MENFQIFRDLKDEGKLHKPLLIRIHILSTLSVILLLVVLYQVIKGNLNIWISIGIAVLAFLLGLHVFSRMSKVEWNEERELISASRMDIVGFTTILLYIAFEISFRTFLKAEYAGTFAATGYLLDGVGASLLGRSVGTLFMIQNLAKVDKEDSG